MINKSIILSVVSLMAFSGIHGMQAGNEGQESSPLRLHLRVKDVELNTKGTGVSFRIKEQESPVLVYKCFADKKNGFTPNNVSECTAMAKNIETQLTTHNLKFLRIFFEVKGKAIDEQGIARQFCDTRRGLDSAKLGLAFDKIEDEAIQSF